MLVSNIKNYNHQQVKNVKYSIDENHEDIHAPIADLDDFLDIISTTNTEKITNLNIQNNTNSSNLTNSIDLCNSLEDLVKTFDQNVKECFSNYKNIDIGQLAPVQVRSQEDIINDSQLWYTLTGNFGNLLPIDYSSSNLSSSKQSLIRKLHNESLNIKNINKKLRYNNFDEFTQDNIDRESYLTDSDYLDSNDDDYDDDDDFLNSKPDKNGKDIEDYLEFDEDEEELREQLDMHSMIIIKNLYNETDLDEPLITAEQVLNEIDSMMNLQEEYYDEMTPDSGVYSTVGLNTSLMESSSTNDDLPLDQSYLTYINTFAQHSSNFNTDANIQLDHNILLIPSKNDLNKLNTFELNEIIEQIESHTKVLSDSLVQEFALKDELEYEKETRNTFISLLTSIQEKRRQLSIENMNNQISSSLMKKRNRKSLINLGQDGNNSSSYLTTIIPYNSEIEYTVQHLQILNKLLKAINEDSHQVPELLTNYILKVVCPT